MEFANLEAESGHQNWHMLKKSHPKYKFQADDSNRNRSWLLPSLKRRIHLLAFYRKREQDI